MALLAQTYSQDAYGIICCLFLAREEAESKFGMIFYRRANDLHRIAVRLRHIPRIRLFSCTIIIAGIIVDAISVIVVVGSGGGGVFAVIAIVCIVIAVVITQLIVTFTGAIVSCQRYCCNRLIVILKWGRHQPSAVSLQSPSSS